MTKTLWAVLMGTVDKIYSEIRYAFRGNRIKEKVFEEIERRGRQKDAVGNIEMFEKAVETLIAVASTMADMVEKIDSNEPNYVLQVSMAYDKALREQANLSLTFVQNRLRPIFAETGSTYDTNIFDDQDDITLIGEFLYFKYANPSNTDEEIVKITSEALNGKDEESKERIGWYAVRVFARTL